MAMTFDTAHRYDEVETDETVNFERMVLEMKSQKGDNYTSDPVCVTWTNLSVHAKAIETSRVNSFAKLLGITPRPKQVHLLEGSCGLAKPGEMLLVLGATDSGCSSLLKAISGDRSGSEGEIICSRKLRGGDGLFCHEEDAHIPELTVAQTLAFASAAKSGSLSKTKHILKDTMVCLLMRMLKIANVQNSRVGSPSIRGISGGERRRVSIAEAMLVGKHIVCYDNATRGLDAATALDVVKTLRARTIAYRTTTVVSLHQASDAIFSQFDNVLTLCHGRQTFFGPAVEARNYFINSGIPDEPTLSTPEFLISLARGGQSSLRVRAQQLSEAFSQSKEAHRLHEHIASCQRSMKEQHAQETCVLPTQSSKQRGSLYSLPFCGQLWLLIRRHLRLTFQNKFSLAVSWVLTVLLAIIVATAWPHMHENANGAFIRGGLMYTVILTTTAQIFSEFAFRALYQPILAKHHGYGLYRPSTFWFAHACVDGLFTGSRIVAFSLIVYLASGLHISASGLLFFIAVLWLVYTCLSLTFRAIACTFQSYDHGIRLGTFLYMLFLLTSGFLISRPEQRPWMRWISYINPISLGFASLIINEFKRLELTCEDAVVPSARYSTKYAGPNSKVCTLTGAETDATTVSGARYIDSAFGFQPSSAFWNYALLWLLAFLALASNLLAGELMYQDTPSRNARPLAPADEEQGKGPQQCLVQTAPTTGPKEPDSVRPVRISFNDVSYTTKLGAVSTGILNGVHGYVRQGEMIAVMGVSGAGKTTLLDVLAQRKPSDSIQGSIMLHDRLDGLRRQHELGYVEQFDALEPTQTVREALRFAADLRQSYSTPRGEKYRYVDSILMDLGLDEISDWKIGGRLNLSQRRRVAIGVELAARPESLLLLDEPTTGLDNQEALNLVRQLRRLADAGLSIICTIHQPNAPTFAQFHRLLLIQRGGRCAYFGDIGPDASSVLLYFQRHGAFVQQGCNIAEWLVATIASGGADWGSIWSASQEQLQLKVEIEHMEREFRGSLPTVSGDPKRQWNSPLRHQVLVVAMRGQRAMWRQPEYWITRLLSHASLGLLTGLVFVQLGAGKIDLLRRVFVVFQTTLLPVMVLTQVQRRFEQQRVIYYREVARKTYGPAAFVVAMILAEIPCTVLSTICYFIPSYYLPGFNVSTERAGYFFLAVLATSMFSVTAGQALCSLAPGVVFTAPFNTALVTIFSLFCGVTIPKHQLPHFWRVWVYEINPFTHLVAGLVSNELHGFGVHCNPNELSNFTAPVNVSCASYMAALFANNGPGYILNGTESVCSYCQYSTGDEYYRPFDIDFADRWRNFGILCIYVFGHVLVCLFGVRYLKFDRSA